MAPPESPEEPLLAVMLREAIEDAGISVSELARRVAKEAGTEPQSERRGLQRYLKGEVVPEPEKARLIARGLGLGEETLVTVGQLQPSLQELILRLDARLAALEARVDRRGRDVQRSLKSILELLEQNHDGQAVRGGRR